MNKRLQTAFLREKLRISMHVTNPHGGKVAFALGLNCVTVVFFFILKRFFTSGAVAFLRE